MKLTKCIFMLCSASVVSRRMSVTIPRSIDPSPHRLQQTVRYSHSTDNTSRSEILLSTPEIIAKHGYPVEEHTVQTEDGYLLSHFRIPHGHKGFNGRRGPPVIVQHGIFAASDTWILMGREKSLGFILADAGYDVWLTNIRGNRHGRKHITLSPNSKNFWDFSWHEMGCYDMPATIDYILAETQEKKLYYIGHSMGTTMFFVMTSMKPEYNEKIRLGIGLAPVAYIRNVRHRVLKSLVPSAAGIADVLNSNKVWEIAAYDKNLASFLGSACREDSPAHNLCVLAYNMAFGEDSAQLNKTLLPIYLSHLIAGTSLNTVLHYTQVIKSGKFQKFDCGPIKNMELYKQSIPPEYEAEKITAPLIFYYGDGDPFSNIESIELLLKRLPHVVPTSRVPYAKFNHIDFILANDGKSLLFDHILELMKAY